MKNHLHERAPSRNRIFTQKVLDQIYPVPGDSTLIGTLYPTLKAAGAEKSPACLMGALGHAFSFMMKKGGGEVWQAEEIDWRLFWEHLPDLGYKFHFFNAILKGKPPAPGAEELTGVCQNAVSAGGFTPSLLKEATAYLSAAVKADRRAVERIETALARLPESKR